MTINWNQSQLDVLAALLDQLVPANSERAIAGAGHPDVVQFIQRRAAENVLLAEWINELLSLLENSSEAITKALIRNLESQVPVAFGALLRECYMGYYSRPAGRIPLGLSAAATQPLGYAVPLEAPGFIDSLVAPVKRRGACYRDC